MILSLWSYFDCTDEKRKHLLKFLPEQQMQDGGWDCLSFKGATHSSFHTIIIVLEGLREFINISNYCENEIAAAQNKTHNFLLLHKIYRSHRTNVIGGKRKTRLSFPPRWYYDILRVLDYFQECRITYDPLMRDALTILMNKR